MSLPDAIGSLQPTPDQLPVLNAKLARIADVPRTMLVKATAPYPAMCIDGRPYSSSSSATSTPTPTSEFCGNNSSLERSKANCAAKIGEEGAGGYQRVDPRHSPQVAGGTLTTWAVDLLLTKFFAGPDPDQFGMWLDNLCAGLRSAGLPVSGHRADSRASGTAGCGAADGLGAILGLLGRRPEGINSFLGRWGIDPDLVPLSIYAQAARLSYTMPSGEELLRILERHSDSPIPVVTGAHKEVAIVANTQHGKVLDRDKVNQMATTNPADPSQSFCLDVWAFSEIATFFTASTPATGKGLIHSTAQIAATAAAFNAAALLVLCGPEAPDIVI